MSALSRVGRTITTACLLAFGLVSLTAQETTGSISGTVTDPTGSTIPGARVEISAPSLPRAISLITDPAGNFTALNIPGGTGYIVTVSANGFASVKKTSVLVDTGRSTRVDFKLELGKTTDSVVVAADAVLVDTSSSSSAVTVDKSFFDILAKGRAFDNLVNLAPGARAESKSGGYQVDGSSGSENVFYLDGMEVTSIQNGTLAGANRLPVEAVQQVQIKNGVMDAQYGGAMGGVVSAVVRSGTNQFHGQVGFYYNNDAMQGRARQALRLNPFNDNIAEYYVQPVTDTFSTWNPIFSFGGPMIKEKLFFFTSYLPSSTSTDRTVTFTTNTTNKFNSQFTQRYLANKVDYVPYSKLRMSFSWIWSPNFTHGLLPAADGTSDPTSTWSQFGNYTSNNTIAGQIDYTLGPKTILSFRGGYNYNNNTNLYAIPLITGIYYSNSNIALAPPGLSGNFLHSAGWLQQPQSATLYNYYPRTNLNADVSHLFDFHGQHSLKAGWGTNRLGNGINSNTYPNGYYRYYWNLAYNCTTVQCTGQQKGAYGYYRYRSLGTFGDVSSNNNALFVQDTWKIKKNLTLNLGLRAEAEFVPSFAIGNNIPSKAISFDWASKLSPRLGFSWDPKSDGKNRIYASFGFFYDVMKYELPRGSFGGDQWKDYFYTMDDPTLPTKLSGVPSNPKGLPGKFLEVIDYRIPSNDPTDNTIDPNLKPMKQRMFDLGWDHSFNPQLVASLRYTNRALVRTIEDTGTLGPNGEVYYIANPGFGITADPKTWGSGYPTTPKAKRDYDAIEVRLDKRFSRSYQFAASYTWSSLRGNYSGLASSDENGRTSPNVNRYFDLPWVNIDKNGKYVDGDLATNRPNTFKFFGGYSKKSKLGLTTLAPTFLIYSGAPITTQASITSGIPVYPYGRGDLGAGPSFNNIDANLTHDFAPFKNHEAMKFRFEFTVFNATNSAKATDIYTTLNHPNDGNGTISAPGGNTTNWFKPWDPIALMNTQKLRKDPQYGLANAFRGPRSARIQLSFFF